MDKLDDVITGKEDIRIGVFKRYVEEAQYYKNENGILEYDGIAEVERSYYFLYFKTDSNLKYYYSDELADFLNIPIDEYVKMQRGHNGKYYDEKDCYVFLTLKDIKGLLDDLSPYIVMAKFTGNNDKCTIDKIVEQDITEDDNYWKGYSEHYSDGRDVDGNDPVIY